MTVYGQRLYNGLSFYLYLDAAIDLLCMAQIEPPRIVSRSQMLWNKWNETKAVVELPNDRKHNELKFIGNGETTLTTAKEQSITSTPLHYLMRLNGCSSYYSVDNPYTLYSEDSSDSYHYPAPSQMLIKTRQSIAQPSSKLSSVAPTFVSKSHHLFMRLSILGNLIGQRSLASDGLGCSVRRFLERQIILLIHSDHDHLRVEHDTTADKCTFVRTKQEENLYNTIIQDLQDVLNVPWLNYPTPKSTSSYAVCLTEWCDIILSWIMLSFFSLSPKQLQSFIDQGFIQISSEILLFLYSLDDPSSTTQTDAAVSNPQCQTILYWSIEAETEVLLDTTVSYDELETTILGALVKLRNLESLSTVSINWHALLHIRFTNIISSSTTETKEDSQHCTLPLIQELFAYISLSWLNSQFIMDCLNSLLLTFCPSFNTDSMAFIAALEDQFNRTLHSINTESSIISNNSLTYHQLPNTSYDFSESSNTPHETHQLPNTSHELSTDTPSHRIISLLKSLRQCWRRHTEMLSSSWLKQRHSFILPAIHRCHKNSLTEDSCTASTPSTASPHNHYITFVQDASELLSAYWNCWHQLTKSLPFLQTSQGERAIELWWTAWHQVSHLLIQDLTERQKDSKGQEESNNGIKREESNSNTLDNSSIHGTLISVCNCVNAIRLMLSCIRQFVIPCPMNCKAHDPNHHSHLKQNRNSAFTAYRLTGWSTHHQQQQQQCSCQRLEPMEKEVLMEQAITEHLLKKTLLHRIEVKISKSAKKPKESDTMVSLTAKASNAMLSDASVFHELLLDWLDIVLHWLDPSLHHYLLHRLLDELVFLLHSVYHRNKNKSQSATFIGECLDSVCQLLVMPEESQLKCSLDDSVTSCLPSQKVSVLVFEQRTADLRAILMPYQTES